MIREWYEQTKMVGPVAWAKGYEQALGAHISPSSLFPLRSSPFNAVSCPISTGISPARKHQNAGGHVDAAIVHWWVYITNSL